MRFKQHLWLISILILLLSGLVYGFMHAASFLEKPATTSRPVDLIVALGGDNGDRVQLASIIYLRGIASRILLTGLEGGRATTRNYYLNWRSQFLLADGISREAIIFDLLSGNSWEEANNTLALMQKNEWQSVLVISDPFHMRRLSWVWRQVFSGSGKSFVLVKTKPIWWKAEQWWTSEMTAQNVVFEYIKIAYYILRY